MLITTTKLKLSAKHSWKLHELMYCERKQPPEKIVGQYNSYSEACSIIDKDWERGGHGPVIFYQNKYYVYLEE